MKTFFILSLKTIGCIIGIVVIYLLCGFLIPMIKISEEKTSEPKTIDIYILTNGVHTDIVMPVKSAEYDWSKLVPFEDTHSKKEYQYLSIGWGDKGFYLDTPTWADLKFSTAFNAAFWLGESALHCTFYDKMTLGKDCKKMTITKTQYQNLIKYISESFDYDKNGKIMLIKTDAVYGENDAFYDAKGSYSFLNTCNSWANKALKVAGQKAALWTPTDTGIFQHYE